MDVVCRFSVALSFNVGLREKFSEEILWFLPPMASVYRLLVAKTPTVGFFRQRCSGYLALLVDVKGGEYELVVRIGCEGLYHFFWSSA